MKCNGQNTSQHALASGRCDIKWLCLRAGVRLLGSVCPEDYGSNTALGRLESARGVRVYPFNTGRVCAFVAGLEFFQAKVSTQTRTLTSKVQAVRVTTCRLFFYFNIVSVSPIFSRIFLASSGVAGRGVE